MGQARQRRGGPGGIHWLLDLIEEHQPALEYDWRTRFGLPLSAVGTPAMTWGEGYRLANVLVGDPSSHTAAGIAGWDYPWPRDVALLADTWDLHAAVNTKKPPPPYPRPWSTAVETTRTGDASMWSQDQIRAELARMRGAVDDGQ